VNLAWVHDPVALVLTMLAAFRLTRLLIDDPFPLGMMRQRLDEWADDRAKRPSEMTDRDRRRSQLYEGEQPVTYLLGCYWCAGFWVSTGCAALASTGPWWLWAATPLAVSAGVGLLSTIDT
jgi:hypothetical protein